MSCKGVYPAHSIREVEHSMYQDQETILGDGFRPVNKGLFDIHPIYL